MDKTKQKGILKETIGAVVLSDAGIKNKYDTMCSPKSVSDSKDKIYYPNLYLSTKEVPSLKGFEVGDELTMVIKGCITSHSIDRNSSGKDEERYSLDIYKAGTINKK